MPDDAKNDPNGLRALADGVRQSNRRAIARAITLVESHRDEDLDAASDLLGFLGSDTRKPALRLGISGVPGVGKSTFLEAFGSYLLRRGLRVAVLAIDPSSTVSGGSVLGDKTRMATLASSDQAFVRPTPGAGASGGISPRTREAMAVLEAANFDVVLVETIGVGQSETAIHDLVDYLLLLVLTGAGDELQGIKRGVLELANGIAVTKADRDNRERAESAARELRSALKILHAARPAGPATVFTCSALEDLGIAEIWSELEQGHRERVESGALEQLRRDQGVLWYERRVQEEAIRRWLQDPRFQRAFEAQRQAVADGRTTPFAAARAAFGSSEPER